MHVGVKRTLARYVIKTGTVSLVHPGPLASFRRLRIVTLQRTTNRIVNEHLIIIPP